MWNKKIIVMGVIVVFALLLFGLAQFFQTIQAGAWSEESEAVDTAYKKTIMAKATKVDTFINDQTFKIVYGEDAVGQKLIVWISDEEIHTEYVSEGLKDKDLLAQFAQKEPTAKLMRVMPGKFKDKFVWELYYKKPGESGRQTYYYDYIDFKDGFLLDTYNLGDKQMM
ncbi:hypothetical protein EHS13_19075 [Paenibacillus psychroresistens]|uniref:Cell wall elongation regulator TseB-like domain-containing protein n=1 Tax=Paenibacillus psychroresistens TaxID=1778678 RepID=A0A6B8RME0_9BACL|nr:DUF5590 domain-containing protein [Paenibacillus psychroresistens]QGQ96832.1 hypothetical protein EHS13_19075 [Paenibacillus psychroresistens]